jgi:uncharacterized protein (TIGR02599 family)
MLVSLVVLSILLLVAFGVVEGMQRSWKATRSRVEQFREARTAFEVITRNLSQATLNTYLDYFYKETGSNVPPSEGMVAPSAYVRQSELHFIAGSARDAVAPGSSRGLHPGHAVFFQAMLGQSRLFRGMPALLNARGYYLQFLGDEGSRPDFLPTGVTRMRHRYRLMEYRPPAERVDERIPGNAVYARPGSWQREGIGVCSRIIADNVVMMLVMPQVPSGMVAGDGRNPWWIAPAYRYNSRDSDNSTPALEPVSVDKAGDVNQGTLHLLPPQLRFTLVALDEESAARWAEMTGHSEVDLQQESGADFLNPELYEQDLGRLTKHLRARRLNYRVFTDIVTLRNARWDSQAFKTP